MDIVVSGGSEFPSKKWSPLCLEYSNWLFPLVNPFGLGWKWKNQIIRNEKVNILKANSKGVYRDRWGRPGYLNRLSKPKLQRHLDRTDVLYFNGSTSGDDVLLNLDVDCHNGETDGKRFTRHLAQLFPGIFWQVSTNGRGFHLYLVVDTEGFEPKVVNAVYGQLAKALRREREGFDISDVEIKGHLWDRDDPSGLKCGTLAKIPWINSFEELEKLKSTFRCSLTELAKLISSLNSKEKETTKVQPSLNVTYCCKAPKEQELSPRRSKGGQKQPANTARRQKAAWDFIREHHRPPTLDELLAYIRENGYFSPPWSFHEDKRRKDCEGIVQQFSGFKPKHSTPDYSQFAKEILLGQAVTYASGKKVLWTDVAIYLSIVDFCCLDDPNPDGSVPCKRFKQLWERYANRLGFDRRWHNSKNRAIREFLVTTGVLTMTDDFYMPRKAMKWTIGPRHPRFGTAERIIPLYRLIRTTDPRVLDEGYILDLLKPSEASLSEGDMEKNCAKWTSDECEAMAA